MATRGSLHYRFQAHDILNTYWTRPSPTSSLLRPDRVILDEAKLSPILFCTGPINWMLEEVTSNKCFIIPKKIGSNKLVVWKRFVSTKVTVTSNTLSKKQLFHSSCLQLNKVCYLVSSLEKQAAFHDTIRMHATDWSIMADFQSSKHCIVG